MEIKPASPFSPPNLSPRPSDPLADLRCQPLPYDLDEKIARVFVCGMEAHFTSRSTSKIGDTLASVEAKIEFSGGLVLGVYKGAQQVVKEYVVFMSEMIQTVANWTLEFYTTVYDPKLFAKVIGALLANPHSPEAAQAVYEVEEIYRIQHPAGSSALLALVEVRRMLDAILQWLRQPRAVAEIMVALAQDLGDLVGSELEAIRAVSDHAEKLGKAIGNIVGRAVMELVLFLLGF